MPSSRFVKDMSGTGVQGVHPGISVLLQPLLHGWWESSMGIHSSVPMSSAWLLIPSCVALDNYASPPGFMPLIHKAGLIIGSP